MKVYTLGTSNRSLEEFLEILKDYQIQVVIDVRRWPTSKFFPHFEKENLEKFLKENQVEYFHFESLGGFREDGYEKYMETKEFKKALKELIKILKEKNTILICAEKFPWKCHRFFIAQALEKKKFEIIHLIEKNKIWEPKKEPKEIKPICQKICLKKK
jgi:uncharacterized protein (DUF488 family)